MRKRESIILLVIFVIVFALASCVYGTAYAEGYNKQKQAESAGRELIPQYSVAVDPDVIPYGSILVDSKGNEYRADDCGGAIKGNHIDIYFSSHEEALNWGRQNIELAIKQ